MVSVGSLDVVPVLVAPVLVALVLVALVGLVLDVLVLELDCISRNSWLRSLSKLDPATPLALEVDPDELLGWTWLCNRL
jgi:energy-converting hydrogenase Eha subunit A